MMYTLSIIIPTNNRSNDIRSKITFIRSNPQFQFLIIENNSTKKEIINYKKIELPSNASISYSTVDGLSAARNKGIREASAEYLWFLDDDDSFGDGFKEFQKIDLIEDIYRPSFSDGNEIRKVGIFKTVKKLDLLDFVQASTFIVKKDLLIKNKLFFDESLKFGEDVEWATRVAATGIKQVRIPGVFMKYTSDNTSIMRTKIESDRLTKLWDILYNSEGKFSKASLLRSIYYTLKGISSGDVEFSSNSSLALWIENKPFHKIRKKAILELSIKDKWMCFINLRNFQKNINLRPNQSIRNIFIPFRYFFIFQSKQFSFHFIR